MKIEKSTLDFLKQLKNNNNREWFATHKTHYEQAKANAEAFMDSLIVEMNRHDQLTTSSGKKSLFRIYNDVRFSKDKSPYNPRFSGYLKRLKPQLRGGYFITIKPGATTVSCGFSFPNAEDLKRLREDISSNYPTWKKLLKSKGLVNFFGAIKGDLVATVPRGFDKNDPALELLRFKQFLFSRNFSDSEVMSDQFLREVNKTYKTIRPLFDYMTEVLTTDANGISVIKT